MLTLMTFVAPSCPCDTLYQVAMCFRPVGSYHVRFILCRAGCITESRNAFATGMSSYHPSIQIYCGWVWVHRVVTIATIQLSHGSMRFPATPVKVMGQRDEQSQRNCVKAGPRTLTTSRVATPATHFTSAVNAITTEHHRAT